MGKRKKKKTKRAPTEPIVEYRRRRAVIREDRDDVQPLRSDRIHTALGTSTLKHNPFGVLKK